MRLRRYYLDTSVLGGYFEPEFLQPTRRLIEEIRDKKSVGVISNLVLGELFDAPTQVKEIALPISGIPWVILKESEESRALAEAYLEAGIVSKRFRDDCRHVALATVSEVDILLSWNCRHIVHYDKIKLFSAVNIIQGYNALEIRTPSEVVDYDE